MWMPRERARWRFNPTTLSTLETGVSLDVDLGLGYDETFRGIRGRRVRRLYDLETIVPRQTSYPAWFFAEVLTDSYDDRTNAPDAERVRGLEMMVFTKKRSAAPWRLSFDTTPNTDPERVLDTAFTDDESYPFTTPPHDNGRIDPSTLHIQLAAYWQHWRDVKQPPLTDVFAPGHWTTTRGAELAATTIPDAGCDCAPEVRYFVDPADGFWIIPASYRGDAPVTYVCSTVRAAITYRPLPERALVQPPDRGSWGGMLPPGTYRRIEAVTARTSCILVPGGENPVHVMGSDGSTISMQGYALE